MSREFLRCVKLATHVAYHHPHQFQTKKLYRSDLVNKSNNISAGDVLMPDNDTEVD